MNTTDTDEESALHRSVQPCRRRNALASPLLRLPTELIFQIFEHAIEIKSVHRRPVLLVLTSTCHQLRGTGIAYPRLWATVDLTNPLMAELFLERCGYNPHTLIRFMSESEKTMGPVQNPRRDALWEKLGGCSFDGLRSIVFEGTEREFACSVVGILQRAPNVSNLDLRNFRYHPTRELPWPVGDSIPKLSTLHLRKFSISWTSLLLRNLTQLVLGLRPPGSSFGYTSMEVFLTALANCPNLEILSLAYTGPHPLYGHQDNCDTVVQLRRLRELSLEFRDTSAVGNTLSHISHPESTELAVYVPVGPNADLSEILSQALPHRNVRSVQHFRKSTTLTVHLLNEPMLFTDNLSVYFQGGGDFRVRAAGPRVLARLASKIVEIVGGDTIVSLSVATQGTGLPDGMWEALLHGLPRLERIYYDLQWAEGDWDFVDPFVSVFSQPYEGGPVCPQLLHLKLPGTMLLWGNSAMVLRRALKKRDGCGRRLKRIGPSGIVTEGLVLEEFRDLVDEVQ